MLYYIILYILLYVILYYICTNHNVTGSLRHDTLTSTSNLKSIYLNGVVQYKNVCSGQYCATQYLEAYIVYIGGILW